MSPLQPARSAAACTTAAGSLLRLIASSRLASLSGSPVKEKQALEAATERLKDEAWAGELLRRARWEIKALSTGPAR